MGKIEKRHLLPSNCRSFDKTLMEIFLEKSCITNIFLALYSFVLVVMETIMQKMEKENVKKLSPWIRYAL